MSRKSSFRPSPPSTPPVARAIDEETRKRIASFYATDEEVEEERQRRLRADAPNSPNSISRLLGFEDYRAYLESPLWRRIKRRIFKRDNRVCIRCQGKANRVHHRSYTLEVMQGNDDEQLASICDGCHTVIHRHTTGAKRLKSEWDVLLLNKERAADHPIVKIDRRRDRWSQIHPVEWERMSALQRNAWEKERDRQFDLWLLQKCGNQGALARILRKGLRERNGMDDEAIDLMLTQAPRRRKATP
jgi:hypothetical protein